MKYKVLMTFQLNNKDRKEVAKILTLAVTPQKAKHVIVGRVGWSYRDVTTVKDFEVGILQFKGLWVCLFCKRQCNEVEPVAVDPVPIGALENEDDIWARLDLFSKSPRQLVGVVREELLEQSIQIEELKQQVAIRDALLKPLMDKQAQETELVVARKFASRSKRSLSGTRRR
jgi:hypothetical protein